MNSWRSHLMVSVFSASLVGMVDLPMGAVELANGKTYFTQPPRLAGASVTHNRVYFWGATYYFTLTLPENAGEPLQKVAIAQQASPDYVRFDLNDTEAFEGRDRHPSTKLSIKTVTADPATQAITVVFDPPVAPGKTITIGLRAIRNPDVGGVYLYGVTAFPRGEQPYGQFLGFGRFNIYDNGAERGVFRRSRFW